MGRPEFKSNFKLNFVHADWFDQLKFNLSGPTRSLIWFFKWSHILPNTHIPPKCIHIDLINLEPKWGDQTPCQGTPMTFYLLVQFGEGKVIVILSFFYPDAAADYWHYWWLIVIVLDAFIVVWHCYCWCCCCWSYSEAGVPLSSLDWLSPNSSNWLRGGSSSSVICFFVDCCWLVFVFCLFCWSNSNWLLVFRDLLHICKRLNNSGMKPIERKQIICYKTQTNSLCSIVDQTWCQSIWDCWEVDFSV